MSGVQTLTIGPGDGDQRLDRWLKRLFPHLAQGRIEKMCRKGELRVDGGRVKANFRLQTGHEVRIPPIPAPGEVTSRPKPQVSDDDAQMIRDCVLFRDDHIIALNKPPGLPTQGGSKQTRHVDGLSEALTFGYDEKPRLVHRLDKDTSGVLLLARTREVARALSAAIRHKETRKIYWALVAGVPTPYLGEIRFGLVKAPGHGKAGEGEKMRCVHPGETVWRAAPPGWRLSRSPAGRTSCARTWPRSVIPSSAMASMAARDRKTWATVGVRNSAGSSAASCICTPGPWLSDTPSPARP